MDRLLVSATHKSSGKTTVSLGLCAAFAARGCVVQPFKKGPDYIDPMLRDEATGDFNEHGNDSWAYDQRGIDHQSGSVR